MNVAPILLALLIQSGLALGSEGHFDSKGVKIHYVTEGEGEAVILIHGWMSDSSMWGADASQKSKLEPLEGFQLIALDCRGHGMSEKPYSKDAYGPELANDVLRLLDHLKISKAHLVGYSMGAFIAAKVAAKAPNRVISLTYGGQSPLIKGAPPTGSNETEVFARTVEAGKGLGAYVLAVYPPDRPKPSAELAEAYAKIMFSGKDVRALAAAGRSFGKLAVSEKELSRSKAPTLFIYGSKEPITLERRVESLRKVLRRSQIRVVQGADHMTTLTKPEFGLAIIEFLRANKTK